MGDDMTTTGTDPAGAERAEGAGRTTRGSEPLPAIAPSLGQLLATRVAATPDREALRAPRGSGWRSWTWQETGEWVHDLAGGLLALGLGPEERVAIAGATSVEWIAVDLAVMCAGGATTTVYPTTNSEDVAYLLSDSGTRFVVADDAAQLAKIEEHRDQLPGVEKVVLIDPSGVEPGPGDGWVLSLEELSSLGKELRAAEPGRVAAAVDAVRPEHLATLIYTSGTTGRPKGVELTHANWCYEAAGTDALSILRPDHLHFLWLPLSHSFGKVLLSAMLQVGFTSVVDGRIDKIVDNLVTIRPTVMAGAPRIFEKVYARVVSTTEAEGGAKAKIFSWAVDVGKKVAARRRAGQSVPPWLAVQHGLADRLVFSKVKERMGGRMEYFVSGSAALSRDVAEWFSAVGLEVLEGYGMTESSAATCVNRPGRNAVGTVGPPLPGTEVRIADDGEILVRGPGVMRGYRNLPDQTAEVLLPDGWLATGDIGTIDDAGRVRITDRKKDLIKTSGGKYIAPSLIESRLKGLCPLLSNVLVHAEGRNFVSAIVTLDPDTVPGFAASEGLAGGMDDWVKDPKIEQVIRDAVTELNLGLNRWETIKEFRVLPRDLSVEEGELTPSLKIKRRVVETRYADVLDSIYSG
jgi:long-chain acyl-CoA synthetase